MSQTHRLGKTSLALFLATCCVCPAPSDAATPAAKPRPTRTSRHHRYVPREKGVDPTLGDIATNDDPIVRAAAIEALGRYNGSVVAVDPNTGRILTVVNQRLAYSDGAIPCSTIKPTIALAALEENVITRDTMLKVGRRKYMNLTDAMAHSNNVFFEQLGARMDLIRFQSMAACWAWVNWRVTTCRMNIRVLSPRHLPPTAALRGCPALAKEFR